MNPPKNTPDSNQPSTTQTVRMTRTEHTPTQPFVPAEKAAPATQQVQSPSPIIAVNTTIIGDIPVKGTHHTPERNFTPSTPPPAPEPPKK